MTVWLTDFLLRFSLFTGFNIFFHCSCTYFGFSYINRSFKSRYNTIDSSRRNKYLLESPVSLIVFVKLGICMNSHSPVTKRATPIGNFRIRKQRVAHSQKLPNRTFVPFPFSLWPFWGTEWKTRRSRSLEALHSRIKRLVIFLIKISSGDRNIASSWPEVFKLAMELGTTP